MALENFKIVFLIRNYEVSYQGPNPLLIRQFFLNLGRGRARKMTARIREIINIATSDIFQNERRAQNRHRDVGKDHVILTRSEFNSLLDEIRELREEVHQLRTKLNHYQELYGPLPKIGFN